MRRLLISLFPYFIIFVLKIAMKKSIFILFFLFLPRLAYAAGVEASPSKLEISASGSSVSAELFVRNPSADVQLFEVYVDEFSENLKINPASFILEAGESKKIAIIFNAQQNKDAIIKTNISVVAKPMTDSTFQFNSGIKIPLTITVGLTSGIFYWWYYAIMAAVAIIIGIVSRIFYIRKKKKQAVVPPLNSPSP